METKSIRETLIDSIIEKKYGDDVSNDSRNRAFLESLTIKELRDLDSEEE